jgi:hypothetical protein
VQPRGHSGNFETKFVVTAGISLGTQAVYLADFFFVSDSKKSLKVFES